MMVTRDARNRRWWLSERGRSVTGRTAALRTGTDLQTRSAPETTFANGPESGFGRQFHRTGSK